MNYSGIASSIKSKVSVLNNIQTVINGIDFEGVWSSAAYESLSTSLNNIISSLNSEKGNLQKFANALVKLDEYVALVKKIKALQDQLNGMPDKTKEENDERKLLMDQISALNTQKQQLRADIVSQISSFGVVNSQTSLVNFGSTSSFDYVVDVGSLLALFSSGKLKTTYDLASAYNTVDSNGNVVAGTGMNYINSQIESVKENYSGREASVNSMLTMLKLGTDKGLKIYYTQSGSNRGDIPYNPTEHVVNGIDCSAYVSWALNNGTAENFHWEGSRAFSRIGNQIDFSEALPGDIFVINNDSTNSHHVGMIIANNPKTGEFIVSDSRGGNTGPNLRMVSYDELLKNGYQVRSMEGYYTGTETNINPYDHN